MEYTFKHALTQEVAYHSVLSERRKLLHERAAEAIETLCPGRVEDHLMEMAHHYRRSGNVPKAVEHLGRAGQRAARQAAHAEAAEYFRTALDLLQHLPDGADRVQQEVALGQSLIEMLWVTRGFAASETIAAVEHLAAAAEQSGSFTQIVDAILSRGAVAPASLALPTASALADQALDLAVREGSPAHLAMAHYLQLRTRYWRGDLAGVEQHFTVGQAFFDHLGFRQYPGFALLPFCFASWNACASGRADVARDRIAQATAAADPNDPFDLAISGMFAAALRVFLREYEQAEVLAAQALGHAENHQFPLIAAGSRLVLGWSRAHRGRAGEGIALIRQGIAYGSEIGSRSDTSNWLGILADAQACAGAVSDALATVEQALQANPDALFWQPENLRLRGALRLAQGQTERAEADFRDAIALARRMGAKAWELRATMSLARLLAQLGHRDDARAMLAEIYNWFTDTSAGGLRSAGGFDTADLKEARTLLEELR